MDKEYKFTIGGKEYKWKIKIPPIPALPTMAQHLEETTDRIYGEKVVPGLPMGHHLRHLLDMPVFHPHLVPEHIKSKLISVGVDPAPLELLAKWTPNNMKSASIQNSVLRMLDECSMSFSIIRYSGVHDAEQFHRRLKKVRELNCVSRANKNISKINFAN